MRECLTKHFTILEPENVFIVNGESLMLSICEMFGQVVIAICTLLLL